MPFFNRKPLFTDFSKVKCKDGGFVKVKTLIFVAKSDPGVPAGNIAFNLVQRKTLSLSVRIAYLQN
jgi:hypothetical protein